MVTEQSNEQLYRSIAENTGEAIIVVRNQRIKYCNATAIELSGYSGAEIRLLPWLRLIHPDDREMALWECGDPSGRREQTAEYSLRANTKDRQTKWLELRHNKIRWNGTEATIVFFRDITARKRLESQFLQAQKMEAVGRLAGGIAHDFNNFLTVILGFTELLEQEMHARNSASTNVKEIREAAEKASALTQKLLAFSRKQHLEPKVIDPNRLVNGMRRILKRLLGENAEVVLKTTRRVGSIHADANQLEQVILNLAVNSRDAMENGGRLVIATENVSFSDEALKPKPEMRAGRYVMLSISDNGSGMDDATKSHLFEPFFTTKESGQGTGLGLATVYGIIKQSKGYIYVYSEPGKGTTFKLYFPRIDTTPADVPETVSGTSKLQGTERILVLEDEQQVLDIIASMLQRRGYGVVAAANPQAAIEYGRANPGAVDLLISDVGIPKASAREIWEEIKKNNPDCRVLFISGYPEDFVPLEDLAEGEKNFLQKPFGSERLLTRVREILDSGRQ